MRKIELGSHVRDTVTGYEGTATSRLEYMNGCVQYCIKPRVGPDGKMPEGEWVDEGQIEVIDEAESAIRDATGGPVLNAPKTYQAW